MFARFDENPAMTLQDIKETKRYGRTDRRTYGRTHTRTHGRENSIPTTNNVCGGYNEGLPIKMTREKFQRNGYFFYEKDNRFNPRLTHKSNFLIGQVPIEKYGFKTLFLLFSI